jgi:hypothetical protein
MRKIRAAVVPLIALVLVCALASFDAQIESVAQFSFMWDVLLGVFVGVILALLPAMCGFSARQNALTSMFWIGGFASLLLIFCQYMSLVTGMQLKDLPFLSGAMPRARIAEGVMLGYCSLIAGRGKI